MRVIGGKAKGKQLKVPNLAYERRIRPLTDSTREALFNILQVHIEGKDFLDLFSGTGAVGIEALSRGARLSIFVEIDKRVAQTLRENIRNTGFDDCAEVYTIAVAKAIQILHRKGARFDYVFVGAPYNTTLAEETIQHISEHPIAHPHALIIVEHSKRVPLQEQYGPFVRTREKVYGETVLSFYNWPGDNN